MFDEKEVDSFFNTEFISAEWNDRPRDFTELIVVEEQEGQPMDYLMQYYYNMDNDKNFQNFFELIM